MKIISNRNYTTPGINGYKRIIDLDNSFCSLYTDFNGFVKQGTILFQTLMETSLIVTTVVTSLALILF